MKISKYSKKNENDFEDIWISWLIKSMSTEPEKEDLDEVKNPFNSYIKNGGMAFYANVDKKCVGVVAIKKLNKFDYEFCKLVVNEDKRGIGIGKKLVEKCFDFVKREKGENLYLQSFYKLEIAVSMYKKMGFIDCKAPNEMLVVKRTEIIMKKTIRS